MGQENILIVNSDESVIEMMTAAVLAQGHQCRAATNSGRALALFEQAPFDIVISDVRMPEIDGLSMMTRMLHVRPDTAFIILTGYGREYSYQRIIGAGAKDFIKKPFTVDEFSNKLKRIVIERRLSEENLRLQKQQAMLADRLSTLIAVSNDLTSELDFDRLFPLIVGKVSEAMAAEHTSLYVIDWKNDEIWTKVAEGIAEIRLPMGQGISGTVARTGEVINTSDAWSLPFFSREFDEKHGFRTKSVLCMPINNRTGERIGVLQVINKKGRDHFNEEDELFFRGLTSQVGIALDNSLLHEELLISFESSISTLSAVVDARHPLTAGHSRRVTEYSLMIAKEMGLTEREMEALKYSALLHDIGKIGIPDEVLLKNGPFTPEEREEMNTHPVKTKHILEKFHFPRSLQDVPDIALYHHEKVNGKGYPSGLTGDQLPLGSRIMAVADVFDALTSRRDYPKYTCRETFDCEPMPLQKAISILRNDAGSHFDPEVVEAFLRCLPEALALHRGAHFPAPYVDAALSDPIFQNNGALRASER